ncbi:MAG: hypothetical protein A3J63_02915 [Candidatus Moranbacteria bacterium RIFCSPHIGHO2_02_FULL_40_12b]|nr:MAG: hypothetical protein A3J63_02915 [Candidatus Moranbacteria bacterium RIFCSPHIGHO2_02_FULL_40_12b]OGI23882.1 MAG: hypothetical protein A3E91_00630 [Candidatus Moranbacteria bacterium RIFCSPHIGHO2_12_FULL_40_10]
MKKEARESEIFYVYPEDNYTNDSIVNSFPDYERKIILSNIFGCGKHIYTISLKKYQLDYLEKSRVLSNLKYKVYIGNNDDGYRLWENPKKNLLKKAAEIIRKASQSKIKRDENIIKVSFSNLNGKNVKLTKGDQLIFSRVSKNMTFLKGGAEPLTYAKEEGIKFDNERRAVEYVERLSAALNKKMLASERFDFLIFKIL